MSSNIELNQVTKSFKGDGITTTVLHSIDLTFNPGELTAITGASGSGKTTLLSLIGLLDKPTTGQILFSGKNVADFSSNQLADFRFAEIGFVFQQFHLIPSLTALENVMTPLHYRKVSFDKVERATSLLQLVGLGDKLMSLPSQLSGGQQQRVAIARALVNDPKWILADEPTGNLDSESGEQVFQLLQQYIRENECGGILITHDENLAERAHRIVKLKDGHIISTENGGKQHDSLCM